MIQELASQLHASERIEARFALRALALAAGLGLAGDLLFNGATPGLNVAVWPALLAASILAMGQGFRLQVPPQRLALLLGAVALCSVVALRASPMLHAVNLGSAAALAALAIAMPAGTGLRRLSFVALVLAACVAAYAVAAGGARFWSSAQVGRGPAARILGASRAGRVLLLVAPLLMVFGGLFVSADAVFEDMAGRVLRIDLGRAPGHVLLATAFGWIALGVIWGMLAVRAPEAPRVELAERHSLRALETGLALGLLAALFGAFVFVQVRYLFGGHDLVERTTGLTYAEYARRGFFELVVVAALLLPVLAVMDWARQKTRGSARVYVVLATVLVALLGVVMVSAAERLRIYQSTFGLTELRVFALAFLGLLGAIFAWFLLSVWRQSRTGFYAGGLALGVIAALALAVWNPSATIAEVNIRRGAEGKVFDREHLAVWLSADAVPAIVRDLESIPLADRCYVGRELVRRWSDREGWRSWNLSRQRAVDLVQAERTRLLGPCVE